MSTACGGKRMMKAIGGRSSAGPPQNNFPAIHPKGNQARVLLSSVLHDRAYTANDEFGSRSINPMELYHNQVTRAQGSFSLRMFHRSWASR